MLKKVSIVSSVHRMPRFWLIWTVLMPKALLSYAVELGPLFHLGVLFYGSKER